MHYLKEFILLGTKPMVGAFGEGTSTGSTIGHYLGKKEHIFPPCVYNLQCNPHDKQTNIKNNL